VWPSNTDQTTDASPALLSATSEVPIGLDLLDPAPEAMKTGAEKPAGDGAGEGPEVCEAPR